MKKNLVIVESPAKARTIGRILKDNYVVKATMGHVRDLPKKELGIDVEKGFAPDYQTIRGRTKVIKEIKDSAKGAAALYLATDPDREGEAISWHVVEAAKLGSLPAKRVVFHELTREAVEDAFRHPRPIDMKLVNAQQARRMLDRLVGYKISPILWRKVMKGLSAGRVQSVAVRMIVEREREIESFVAREYWSIVAELTKQGNSAHFRAEFAGLVGKKKLEVGSSEEANTLCAILRDARYTVAKVQRKKVPRRPVSPFITSTLQQEAWRKLRFNAKYTMSLAQDLYEGVPIGEKEPVGLITYMRTDSTHVAAQAIAEVREFIHGRYGADYLPHTARTFRKKVKGAQEAHEAIRPTSVKREPAMMQPYLTGDQLKLYQLVWNRMVASQMADAQLDSVSVEIEAEPAASPGKYLFRAASSSLEFPGFLALYSEGKDEQEGEEEAVALPALAAGEALDLLGLLPEQHFTKPPARYTEATLIKALEDNGIGRPSTYAPTLSIIQERDYVAREKGHFKPNEMGFTVTDLLIEHFPLIVSIGFTARMEERLDEISSGQREWIPTLEEFYQFFAAEVDKAAVNMPKVKRPPEPTDEVCERCGGQMVIRTGRFGKFLSCGNFPKCKNAKPIRNNVDVACPKCGAKLVERRTKKRRVFYGCSNYPKCDFAVWEKPHSIPCPECRGMLTSKGADNVKCANCGFEGDPKELADKELARAH